MIRGWMVTLALAGLVVAGAALVSGGARAPAPDVGAQAAPEWDPCFRYGRFECCVRPEDR